MSSLCEEIDLVFGQLHMKCKIKVMFVHQVHCFGRWCVLEIYLI